MRTAIVSLMPIATRVAAALGFARAATTGTTTESVVHAPPRSATRREVSPGDAVSLSTVYRALQIITTAAIQISYQVERNGRRLPDADVPSLMKKPCLEMSRSEFVEQTVMSLAVSGNAYWRKRRAPGATGDVLNLEPLNPHDVRPAKDPKTGRTVYHHGSTVYPASDIQHVSIMKMPGKLTGLGPIQAAQIELRGALELRDYAALWFSEGKIPSGILTSEQVLTPDDAKAFKSAWNGTTENPVENPSGVKVLGKGTTYHPIMLKPADAQWLESQQFTTTQLARLFGTPASLMLAAVEGSAMTYSNVEQDWIAFVRFTLLGYLRPIEEALTELTVRGQEVRFNFEALLRTDTKTRFESHEIGLRAGFLDADEVRAIEGYAPMTKAQRDARTPAPAPSESENAA